MNTADVIAAFEDAAQARGLILPPDPVIGRIARCPVEGGRRGRRDGAYILFLDGHPAGGFQNHKDGRGWEKWCYSNGTSQLTPVERTAFAKEIAAKKQAAGKERQRLAEAARREAVAWFDNADQADPAHSYLVEKRVKPHGIRQARGELLVPRHDMVSGELVNLQRILPDGTKLNLEGGRVDGTWFIIGKSGDTILVAEGYGAAATGYEVIGHAAVVAFGSGKLEAAAVEVRKQHRQARIVILADDDWRREGNPGLTAATKAARAVDAFMAVPTFGADRGDDDSDFNDLFRLAGADAVRAAIENAAKPPTDWPDIDPALVEDARRHIPVFPVFLLPPLWRDWIVATAEGAGAPVDYVALALLASVAGVTGCAITVQATPSWCEPLILWLALVGSPSTGKSPALDPARQLLDALEAEAKEGDEERRRLYETNVEAGKVAADMWREVLAIATKKNTPPPVKPAEACQVGSFVPTQFVVGDTTIESVVDVVKGNPRGVVLWRDELTGWLMNVARYGGGNDRPFWLERWSAASATVNRKNRPPVHIPRLGASIIGGIQPDRLGEIFAEVDDGMAARLLYAYPSRPPYTSLLQRRGGHDDRALGRLRQIGAASGSADNPLVLKLDVGAVRLLDEFCAEHHAEADEHEGLEGGFFGKGRGYVVRLAGVLSLLAWSETDGAVPPPPITAEVVGDAAGLWADYFWPVARATFAGGGKTQADRQARRIVAWIRRTEASTISLEDVRVRALGRALRAAEATVLIDRLVGGGVLRPAPGGAAKGPGRPAYRWDVNPALHAPKPEGSDA